MSKINNTNLHSEEYLENASFIAELFHDAMFGEDRFQKPWQREVKLGLQNFFDFEYEIDNFGEIYMLSPIRNERIYVGLKAFEDLVQFLAGRDGMNLSEFQIGVIVQLTRVYVEVCPSRVPAREVPASCGLEEGALKYGSYAL
jgi:hypothetical protein